MNCVQLLDIFINDYDPQHSIHIDDVLFYAYPKYILGSKCMMTDDTGIFMIVKFHSFFIVNWFFK